MRIKRGYLYSADLNPRFGTETGKIRPVLVIQTDLMNTDHPSTIILPLTSQVRPQAEILRIHLKKGESGLKKDSDVMIDQMRSIDNRRFKSELGRLSGERLQEIEEKLRVIIDLE